MPPCVGGRWRVRGDGSGGIMARAAQGEAASEVLVPLKGSQLCTATTAGPGKLAVVVELVVARSLVDLVKPAEREDFYIVVVEVSLDRRKMDQL